MAGINLALEAFSSAQVLRLTGITPKQLTYWDQKGLVKPSRSPASGRGSRRLYSYLDLLALMTVKALKRRLSLQKVRKCVSFLRGRLPDISQPLSFCQLIACGDTVYLARDEAAWVDTLKVPGQTALKEILDIAMFDRELRQRVLELVVKRVEQVRVGDYAYQVEVEPDEEEGGYVATVPALPGCITQGNTLEDVLDSAADAIKCWLEAQEDLARKGVKVPTSKGRRRARVTA
ncbi:hypothetical protein LCGC14_1683180 [marine sediment metagenome]|uniref:HTH merR-type domain-containing protein n=1 Tax=marine sediment metagenome TaxID=412755 RepID=A0A0F9HN46_9ZZZZ